MRTRYMNWLVLAIVLGLVLHVPVSTLAMGRDQGLTYVHRPKKFDGSTDQLIVTLKPGIRRSGADSVFWRQFGSSARTSTAVSTRYQRQYDASTHILRVSRNLDVKQLNAVIAAWQHIPGVERVEADARMYSTTTPNDTYYDNQWDLMGYGSVFDGNNNYGIGVEAAWNAGYTGADVVVAVLDTGILNHPDLVGKVVDQYDFIHDVAVANDGNGRDSNASDEGDFVTLAESTDETGGLWGCDVGDSSWHGTHVAGTIAAVTNNTTGVAGIARDANLIIGRVLGKCGGYTSDIAAAIRWAAGLTVIGLPTTSYPADVINMSLGGYGACESDGIYQSAIDAAVAAGTTVVVAAGNSNDDASDYSPASCNNVITVASTAGNGKRAYYSNYGVAVDVAAPGGDYTVDTMILSTHHTGATTPASGTYAYSYMQGTSMAAPHVAGLAALWYDLDPTATPAQIEDWIKTTTQSFPTDTAATGCASRGCGAGIISAANLLPTQSFSAVLPDTLAYGDTSDVLVTLTDEGIDGSWSRNASSSSVCQLNGDDTVSAIGVGTCGLTYSNAGSSSYRSFSMSHTITVEKAEQSFAPTVPASVIGTSLSAVLSITTDQLLKGTWKTTTPAICKISANKVQGVTPGDCEVVFSQTGSTLYKSYQYTDTVTILPKMTQNYTAVLPDDIIGTSTSATFAAASDEDVSGSWKSVTTGICKMKGRDAVIGVAPGECTVVFSNKTTSLYESFVYTGTITILPKLTQTYSATIPVSVTGTSQSAVLQALTDQGIKGSWTTVDRTICRIVAGKVAGVSPGTCVLQYTNKGNSMYEPFLKAAPLTRTLTIAPKLTQSYGGSVPTNMQVGNTHALTLTTAEALPLKVATTPTSVCKVTSGMLMAVAPGTCTVTLSNTGSALYAPFTQVTVVTVAP